MILLPKACLAAIRKGSNPENFQLFFLQTTDLRDRITSVVMCEVLTTDANGLEI